MHSLFSRVLASVLIAVPGAFAQTRPARIPRPVPAAAEARSPARARALPNSAPGAPAPVRASDSALAELSGIWRGVVHIYPSLFHVELELSIRGEELAGRARFQPLTDVWARRSFDASTESGSCDVSMRFDSITDTFRLGLGRDRSGRGYAIASLLGNVEGVYDRPGATLAGKDGSRSGFFLFTRDAHFPAVEKSLAKFRNIGPQGPRGFGWAGGPSKADLLRWFEPFPREHPQVDAYRTPHGPLELLAINLLEDQHFRSIFGATFDQLSASQLDSIYKANRKPTNDKREQGLSALSGMFSPAPGTHNAKEMTLWVFALRAIRAWRQAELGKLASLPPSDDAFAIIQSLSDQLTAKTKGTLWPGEQTQNEEKVAAARRSLAQPSLERKIDELEAGPLAQATLASLTQWPQAQAALLAAVEPAVRADFQRRVDTRIDAVLEGLMPEELTKVGQLGDGLGAVENGTAWYARFAQEYAPTLRRPACQAVLARFQARRRDDLLAARDEMMAWVRSGFEQIPSEASPRVARQRIDYCNRLAAQLATWFGTPGDAQSEAGRAVRALANDLGGAVRSLLPPRQRGPIAFNAAPTASGRARQTGTPRQLAEVSGFFVFWVIDADREALWRAMLPPPVIDPGFEFASDVCWAIFHGSFDEIRNAPQQRSGMGSQFAAQLRKTNPQFHHAFVSFVGLATQKYGERQIGPSEKIWWKVTVTRNGQQVEQRDNQHPVYIPIVLKDYYESSYKLAEAAANVDGVYGNNPFGIFKTVLELAASGVGGMLSQAGTRADGSIAVRLAEWEKPILADLGRLLDSWPDRSFAVWQFQENIRRFLAGQKSYQALFQEATAENRWTPLHLAARRDDRAGVEWLIAEGANVDVRDATGATPLHLAALGGCTDAMDALWKASAKPDFPTSKGETALHYAVKFDAADAVRRLLAMPAAADAADASGSTPLHDAARMGSLGALKALLSGGASAAVVDREGRTPLALAALKNHPEAVRLLLAQPGADPNAKDAAGLTLLHRAAEANAKDIIGELVAKGADPNAKSRAGQTPLHVAALHHAANAIDALVIRGADPFAKDADGKTPIDLAIAENHEPTILALRKHMPAQR